MYIDSTYYEPTFLYESIWNFIGFIILIILRKCKKVKTGQLTGFYLMWYGIGRFIIESFRSDSLYLGPLRIAQLVSIVMFLIGLFIIIRPNKEYYNKKKDAN